MNDRQSMDIAHWKGMTSSKPKEKITKEAVEKFRISTHTNGSSEMIPPTYLTRFRLTEFELFKKMGVSLSQVLHGEQLYNYKEPLKIGDEIEYQSTIQEVKEKTGKSGKMVFVHILADFIRTQDQVILASSDTTIIVRIQA